MTADLPDQTPSRLPEDNDTPFGPPPAAPNDPNDQPEERQVDGSDLDDTHPATDTGLQPEEEYHEGKSGAAEAMEPNLGDAVVGYDDEPDNQKDES